MLHSVEWCNWQTGDNACQYRIIIQEHGSEEIPQLVPDTTTLRETNMCLMCTHFCRRTYYALLMGIYHMQILFCVFPILIATSIQMHVWTLVMCFVLTHAYLIQISTNYVYACAFVRRASKNQQRKVDDLEQLSGSAVGHKTTKPLDTQPKRQQRKKL